MSLKELYGSILNEIANLPVIDTHEHMEDEESRLKRPVDMFNTYLTHYASCDLISAGMADGDMAFLKGASEDIEKKWSIFRPYWEKARNTVYCKSLILATQKIYGIEDINDGTYRLIDTEMRKKNQKGLYEYILKELCNIEISILDSNVDCDRRYFISTERFDHFIRFKSRSAVTDMERRYNTSVNSLSDWVLLLKKAVADCKAKHGIPCIKSGLAYERVLQYLRTDYSEAGKVFNRILSSHAYFGWNTFEPVDVNTKPLEDYMMHILVQTAAELELPIQFHTGLQEGNGNNITNSNPANLINLFMEYPNARFDIFHGGYPYGGELCAIAKNFRNVYVDLCWSNIISREYTVRLIEELLDTVPSNKIFGFGGDYCFVEGVCGHLIIARENIALALANKADKGYLSVSECIDIAGRMLYGNAKEFFRL